MLYITPIQLKFIPVAMASAERNNAFGLTFSDSVHPLCIVNPQPVCQRANSLGEVGAVCQDWDSAEME
jgi:hypothetical protein